MRDDADQDRRSFTTMRDADMIQLIVVTTPTG
jgi:hypothetical protein